MMTRGKLCCLVFLSVCFLVLSWNVLKKAVNVTRKPTLARDPGSRHRPVHVAGHATHGTRNPKCKLSKNTKNRREKIKIKKKQLQTLWPRRSIDFAQSPMPNFLLAPTCRPSTAKPQTRRPTASWWPDLRCGKGYTRRVSTQIGWPQIWATYNSHHSHLLIL